MPSSVSLSFSRAKSLRAKDANEERRRARAGCGVLKGEPERKRRVKRLELLRENEERARRIFSPFEACGLSLSLSLSGGGGRLDSTRSFLRELYDSSTPAAKKEEGRKEAERKLQRRWRRFSLSSPGWARARAREVSNKKNKTARGNREEVEEEAATCATPRLFTLRSSGSPLGGPSGAGGSWFSVLEQKEQRDRRAKTEAPAPPGNERASETDDLPRARLAFFLLSLCTHVHIIHV